MNEWWGAQNPDDVYFICAFDWSDLGWPMPYATSIHSVYYEFANGTVPFFAVIGAYNIYMYGENDYQAALDMVPDAIDSFNYMGVLNPIPPQSIYYGEVDTFDLNDVFGNPTGEPLTVTLQGNTNPNVVEAEVTNNILTLTAQNISGNSTITILATAGTQNFEYDFSVVVCGQADKFVLILDLDETPTGSTLQASIENCYAGGDVHIISDPLTFSGYPLANTDAVFVLLGVYPNNSVLREYQVGSLVSYIEGGGNVYLESSNTWWRDPYFYQGYDFTSLFGINSYTEFPQNIINVDGHDFLDGMSWTYYGENTPYSISQVDPIAPAVTIFSNPTAGYNCGVAYDSGTYKTIGTSFEITGLGGTNSLDDAIAGIIEFFDFAPPLLPPTNLAIDELTGLFTWDAPAIDELTGYDVYLDGVLQGNTTDLEWQFTNLINGTTYEAGVEAVYDEGSSNLVTIEFTYNGTDAGNNIVVVTELKGNFPNPFNPETNIAYSIKEAGYVTLEVYNVRGQLVKTLVDDERETGNYSVVWNGKDNSNKPVSSGVYFYKMKADKFVSTKKMILMK